MVVNMTPRQRKILVAIVSIGYALFLSIANYPKAGFFGIFQGLIMFVSIWALGAWFADAESAEMLDKIEKQLDKMGMRDDA